MASSLTSSSIAKLRGQLAISVGDLAARASQLAGRGTGSSIRGMVINKLAPNLFDQLLAGKRVALVSGTNGKTTTTHFLTAAMREAAGRPDDVVTNPEGANLREGIVSALSTNRRAPIAVLEVDEQIVPSAVQAGAPEVLIMLNFSRDQLDRHHEINALGRRWRAALEAAGQAAPVAVANANDPLIVWAANAAREQIWVDLGTGFNMDAALCPQCGSILTFEADDWACPDCELRRPQPDYWVADGRVYLATGVSYELNLQTPGRFNQGNAACAMAAARVMGVEPQVALRGIRQVSSPAGRFAVGEYRQPDGRVTKARLMLSKNPAGWLEGLLIMKSDPVILAIDSDIADGADVSWLYDVEYEQLRGRRVIATGPRCLDLSVRLHYAEVEHEVIPELSDALRGPFDQTIDVLATYSAFLRLCRMGGVELK